LLVSLYQEEQGSRVLSRKEPPRDGGGALPVQNEYQVIQIRY